MTRVEYTQALQSVAKEIQGDNYAGDEYYDQRAWDDYFDDATSPEDAVREDMSYWE
jgi:hypothetical protein